MLVMNRFIRQQGHRQTVMATSDPRHAVVYQCRSTPGLFHCVETTEPTRSHRHHTLTCFHRRLHRLIHYIQLHTYLVTATNTHRFTWKISSLWDSKECSLSFRFRRSHSATVYTTHMQLHIINSVISCQFMPSVLWSCWLGGRKGIRPVKNMEWWVAGMVICLEQGANDLHMVQLMPLPLHHLLL